MAVSTGLRFTTLPPVTAPGSPPPSPPTTLTLVYNPLIGFVSSAYSAQVSPTVALSSRFGVNIYSYESDLSVGGEWWIGRRRGKRGLGEVAEPAPQLPHGGPSLREDGEDMQRQLDSPFPIKKEPIRDEVAEKRLDSPVPLIQAFSRATKGVQRAHVSPTGSVESDRDGVLKARLSGNWVSLTCPRLESRALTTVSCPLVRSTYTELSGLGWPHIRLGCEEAYQICGVGSAILFVAHLP
jgi:distribution and morphology protein 10